MKRKLIFVGALLVVSSSTIAQQQEPTEIPTVEISGKFSTLFYRGGPNVTLITKEKLSNYQGQQLTQVLQSVAGFHITGADSNNPEPKIARVRGGKLANVLILIDGVPMRDVTGNDYNAMDLRLLSLDIIESIEIINGANSVLYGSNAASTVINITTKSGSQSKLAGELGLHAGSFGTFGQKAAVQGKSGAWNYSLRGSNELSEGISSAEGEGFEKDGFWRQNFVVHGGYSKGNVQLSVNSGVTTHAFDFDQGAFADGKDRGEDLQYYAGVQGTLRYGKGTLRLNGRFSENQRKIKQYTSSEYQLQNEYQGRVGYFELVNRWNISDFVTLLSGAELEKQSMGSRSVPWGESILKEELALKDTQLSHMDLFTQVNLHKGSMHLDVGGRALKHSRFGTHGVYSINPYILKEGKNYYAKIGYSIASAFIAPTLYQTYGTLPYTRPNPDLQPETNISQQINLAYGATDGTFLFQGSLFRREEKNVFTYRTLEDYTGRFENVEQNKVEGVEIGMEGKFATWLAAQSNYTFIQKQKEQTMLRQPKHRVNNSVMVYPFHGSVLRLSHQYVSKRRDSYWDSSLFKVVDTNVKGYNLIHLHAGIEYKKAFQVYIDVFNLLNQNYTDVVGYSHRPRSITVGTTYNF